MEKSLAAEEAFVNKMKSKHGVKDDEEVEKNDKPDSDEVK
jgi:hypothetical protein